MKLAVSEGVKQRVEELVAALKEAHGEDLSGVIAHGSAARGGWKEGSDVDVVVVLKKSTRASLERAANALKGARWSARIEAMVLVEREIARAADVFPVFYDEIRRHHVVLYGHDPFSDLRIEPHHMRLRIEQELREVQIRLRRAVVDAGGSRDALAGAVWRKVRQLRSPLFALLTRKGMKGDDHTRSVLESAGAAFKIDVAPLTRVEDDPAAAHDALVALLDAAIADVDAMEDRP